MRIVSKRQVVAAFAAFAFSAACGSGKSTDPAPATAKPAATKDATDAGSPAAAAAEAGPTRPFAGSPMEATALIGAAIDQRSAEMHKCVQEYRTRKKMPHERVTISMGIDQEGRLLGATLPKGKADAALAECVLAALANAPFPRSHSGVISIAKSYEEIVQ